MPNNHYRIDGNDNYHLVGVDDYAPPGYCTASCTVGRNSRLLFLFKGEEPSEEGCAGYICIPRLGDPPPGVFDWNGSWYPLTTDTKSAFAELATRFENED